MKFNGTQDELEQAIESQYGNYQVQASGDATLYMNGQNLQVGLWKDAEGGFILSPDVNLENK